MNIKNIARRRGVTIAAAALSVAMVSPFVHAVTPGTPFVSVANAQQDQASTPPASGSDKAIYSPGKATQTGTISGSVKEIVETLVGFDKVQASGKAVKGVKVYAQWYEGENTQHSSPVYYTESDANGNFTLKMAPYTDALGVTRHFDADATVGLTTGDDRGKRDQKREKIRVWTELPEDLTDKYRLVHQPAAGIFPLTTTTPISQGDGEWGGNKITGMTIQYAQKDKLPQHLPKEKWAESTGTGGNEGTYAGQAFWNLDVLQGAKNHNQVSKFDPKDIPAAGMKVVGSYLTDDAVNKIEAYAKANFAGKTLRGNGWTFVDEQGLQKWINEQVAADPTGWIAETLTTTTGADGKFELRWKGIYGNSHKSKPLTMSEDQFGKLAGAHGEGSWLNGNSKSKHVNMHWSYVSILGKDGKPLPDNIGTLYPWALGQWAGPGFGIHLNAGGGAHYFGGDSTFIGNETDGYTGWNIALAPQALKFDVVDKNTTDNWATVGDKVQTDTAGLPIADNLNYYIEWVDKSGKVVKTCATAKPDSATKIPSCELEVPADAQTGDTFTARLKVTPNNPDPKNDLVLAMDAFAVARDYLAYDPIDAKRGEEATSEPKFDNPATETEETKPDKAKFELGKLPEGVTEDQVKVDPATGVVTFTPKADQAAKAYSFPVVMRNEELQVPVLDENGDPVKDGSGNPKTQGRIVARADATFNVAELTANTVEPAYEGKLVVPGQETKSAPSFTDKEGKEAKAPEGSKFTIGEDFTAPEGYEVSIDENNGEITVTFPDKSKLSGKTAEEFDVPVTVTYPDGSKDDAKANFKLDTDGDGDPDVTDPDDDGDGIPDEDDSNPKVPNVNEHFDPKYTDGSGKPGSDVKIEAPTFTDKDGKDTEAPEGTKFTPGDDAPEGVKVDENTGEITVTIPEGANPGDEIKVPVVVTYPDGTKDNVEVTVTVTEKDNGVYEPAYEGKLVVPGQETKSAPSFTDKEGKEAKAPEGSKFTIGEDFTAPEGYEVSIDENNGEITVTFPDGSKLNKDTTEEFDVPVTVTYPDESTDEVKANFKLDTDGDGTPDTTDEDDDGDGIPDKVEKDKGSNPKNKGSIPATPLEPGKPTNAAIFEPKYKSELVVPGQETKSAPSFTDKEGKEAKAPEGSKFTIGEDFTAPEGYEVSIDENNGEITVTFPDGSKLNKDTTEEFDVPVTVTYPDESTDEVKANFKLDTDGDGTPDVTDEDDDGDGIPDKDDSNPKVPNANDHYDPKYTDGSGKPGSDVKIEAPTFTDKDGKDTEAPEGTKFTPGDDAPEGVKVDENTGEITVEVPEDATPGTKIEVPVVVTYPDGSTDEVTVTVTAIGDYAVKYDPATGKVGEDIVAEPKNVGKHEAPADTTYAAGKKETHDGLWTISDPAQDGKITAKVDSKALKDRYISERDKAFGKKCEDGAVITEQDAKDFLKKFAQLFNAKSAVDVTFTPEDKQQVEATFMLLDANGKPLAENQDWDGDGVSNVEEIQNCSNPFDKSDVEGSKPLEPSFKYPAWDNATTVPGESVDINKTEDSGDFTPGTTVKVTEGPGKAEIDENGKITVTPTPEAKVGDKIVVEVKDPNGKVIDTVEVEITSHELSSRKGCTESLLGFGIPLLALIPLGIAMQAAIPGLQSFQAQVNQQIQDMNTALQRQMGILDPNMARAAADFNARLQGAGANLGQVLAGLAVLAYGVAAIVTIATTCDPKNPNKRESTLDFSSAFGKTGEQGSSEKQEGENGSSDQTEGSSRQTDTPVVPEPEQPAPVVEENNDAPEAADADAEVEENPAN